MDTEIIRAIILGIVQGITEFFPISSTAHLILFPWFFGWEGRVDTLSFDIALHTGTLAAIVICFFKDWIEILTKRPKLLSLLILSTIPGGLCGFFFDDLVETTLRSPLIISISLTGIGVFMFLSERHYKKRMIKSSLGAITLSDAILIGFAQAVALIPGVSRSGITISTALFRGVSRETAAKYSFLMATPIIAGATILEGISMINVGDFRGDISLFAAGIAASFLSGLGAIKFLMIFFRKYSLRVFVYYRFALAFIIIAVMLLHYYG